MSRVSLKKILAVFAIIFAMSRTGKIIDFFSKFDTGGIFTMEPLRRCSENARYVVTLLFCAMCFLIIWRILIIKK